MRSTSGTAAAAATHRRQEEPWRNQEPNHRAVRTVVLTEKAATGDSDADATAGEAEQTNAVPAVESKKVVKPAQGNNLNANAGAGATANEPKKRRKQQQDEEKPAEAMLAVAVVPDHAGYLSIASPAAASARS